MVKRLIAGIVFCLFLGSCSWFMGDRSMTYQELQGNFTDLFDGSSLNNWVVMGKPEGWQVANGVIRSEGGKGGEWLRSVKEYDNFILQLEYRVAPGGNSGVFFRCPEQGNPWETGYECQISNEQPPRDDLHCTGTLYGLAAAHPRPDESPEIWHSCKIICKNKRILLFIDGQQTVDSDMDKIEAIKDKPMKGYIGLQDSHTGEGKWIEYRNIRIRELNPRGRM